MLWSCSNVPRDSLPTLIISRSQTHHQSGQITNTPPKWSFSRTTRDPYGDHNHDQHLVSNRDPYGDHNHDQYLARDPYGDHNHLSHYQDIVVTPHDYLIVQVTIFLLSHIYLPT